MCSSDAPIPPNDQDGVCCQNNENRFFESIIYEFGLMSVILYETS